MSADLKDDFIGSLSSRLENILPNRSGYIIAEVELNAQFILTTNLLLSNCKPSPHNGNQSFMPNIIEAFTAILEKLNVDPQTRKLRPREDKTLTSTLVVMKLLAALVRFSWDRNSQFNRIKSRVRNEGINFNYELASHAKNYEYYLFTPPELVGIDVQHTLEVLFCILSEEVNRKALSFIKKTPFENQDSYGLPPDSDLSNEEAASHIHDIDTYVLLVLRYISASNAVDYYSFLSRRLFSWAERGEYIPTSALQKYACLLKFLYYTEEVIRLYARQIYSVMPYIRSNTWKQIFLYYDASNVQHQALHRAHFYTKFILAADVEQNCKVLFDYVSTVFEDLRMAGVSPSLHSWFVIFCPSDFNELLHKPNRLKQAFNKRVKFLTAILRDSQARDNLEAFESLSNIFALGARIPEVKDGVREFSERHIDDVFENMIKMQSKCTTEALMDDYRPLYVSLFTSAIAINPGKYIDYLVKFYLQSKEANKDGCRDRCTCRDIHACVKVIKGLSELEQYKPYFFQVMQRLHEELKELVFVAYGKLSHFETTRPTLSSSSSVLSSPTDKIVLEVDRTSVAHNPLFATLKKSNLDHSYHGEKAAEELKDDTEAAETLSSQTIAHISSLSAESYSSKCVGISEKMMADLFQIFAAAPELYLCSFADVKVEEFKADRIAILDKLTAFATEISLPIKQAIHFKSVNGNSELFESACALAMTLVDNELLRDTPIKECTTFVISHVIIKAIAEACTIFSLTDPNFKLCFIFLNRFMQERDLAYADVARNVLIAEDWGHSSCASVAEAVEIILLLALCTHDVQFFGMAKITMQWHCYEVDHGKHLPQCFESNLSDVFKRILADDSVFTGFVSLHKKFRNILMEAQPTMSLYRVWLLIYQRWSDKIDGNSALSDESLIFRHYTGFLVSTSGCFLSKDFAKNDPREREAAQGMISAFFDRAISLLKSSELVIRVVIKDALSNESHPAVFHLICTKLMNVAIYYVDQELITEEGVLYIEQMMTIMSAMINMKNDGSFTLVALLPGVLEFLIKFINMVSNPVDLLKLKLRFCKLGQTIEGSRDRNGLRGAFKLRNHFAKATAEWLEQAVFYNDNDSTADDALSILTSPTLSTAGSSQGSKNSELEYLYVELASESSKCLETQLQNLLLDIPDGTKEKNMKQSKDLIFSNYFSLFYKILQKYTLSQPTPNMLKFKYKIQGITDNVLKCVSNILQSDAQIGMQFVLPMGYHENKKIRSIFLNVFANMLSTRKLKNGQEEFPDRLVTELANIYTIYGAAAEVASPAEHNLLASSLYGLFGYTRKLDKLFVTLLQDEISNVARSSDIFRRNSTLTRLMSIFAKEYGLPYLTVVLKPLIEEIIVNEVEFEVEKSWEEEDVLIFMHYLTKLVDGIVNSTIWVPDSFKYICAEIYKFVKAKFEDAAVVAIGSFIFLRFFCPAIVSPESFFDLSCTNVKVKRSLIQLVKVLQYMANGSLAVLKWPGLLERSDELSELNAKIFGYLEEVSKTYDTDEYAFHSLTVKPTTGLRYIHKFFYTYFIYVKHQFILGDPLANAVNLHERCDTWRRLDAVMLELGLPKTYISLQGTSSYKAVDVSGNLGNSQYTEFMAKMSAKNIEMAVDCPIIHSGVFNDGTPVVTVNFRYLRDIGYDMSTFVYLILEAASQVWDNKFYIVLDFTQFFYMGIIGKNYVSLMRNYAPAIFFKSCARTYYFNLPRMRYISLIRDMVTMRIENNSLNQKIYFYSQVDKPEIINSLCLEEAVVAINRDVRVIFKDCKAFDEGLQQFVPVTIKLGRKWMQICFQRVEHKAFYTGTDTVSPVETHVLSDLTRCEISSKHSDSNEFTLSLNKYNYEVTLVSPQRQEILRFLYFAMLRNAKQYVENNVDYDLVESRLHWFGRLYNIVFHALLEPDEDVRASASFLFASMATYFDVEVGISPSHANRIAYPSDTTEFVVSVSKFLSKFRPERSYRFFKAFFSNFDRLPEENRMSGIMYISPWIENVGDHIFMDEEHGTEKVADIVRQFCRITSQNKLMKPLLNDYIWKKLFADLRMTPVLLDEIIGFAIDNKNDGPEWGSIMSVISPSVELCGEVVSRLQDCIHKASRDDSDIASQSKLLEIMVLVKVCASVFFNSFLFGSLYLLDVFFFCSLFIDNPSLEFGSDLQKLVINTIQSFIHKPNLTPEQKQLIDDTIEYFSGQRARMLFGLNSRERAAGTDINHAYNRATAFDLLCDYLNDFIAKMGSADDRTKWTTRWCSLAMDIAFSGTSVFQRRAILVVGTLARSGISDSTGGRILRLLGRQPQETAEAMTNSGICYARLEAGLSNDSVYLPLIIWAQIACGLLHMPSMYQSVVTCIASTIGKLEQTPGYLDNVMSQRYRLEPLLSNFEQVVGNKVTRKNIELCIMFTVCQGLTVSHFRHTSIGCLKSIADLKFANKIPEIRDSPSKYHYLFILFLSASDSAFMEHMTELNLANDDVAMVAKHQIPNVIVEHIIKDDNDAKLVLILAAYIFDGECDPTYKLKFISIYTHIYKALRKTALLIFHIVKAGLQNHLVNSDSIDLVNDISRLFVQVSQERSYSARDCEAEVNLLFEEYNFHRLESLDQFRDFHSHDAKNNLTLVRNVQEMLYRSFSSVVEGQRLEKF